MIKQLVFVFSAAPHSSASARESLDAALAASAVSDDIVIYFYGDGVLQLLDKQQPADILQRHVLPTYGLLELYDVEELYVDPQSLIERGLTADQLAISVNPLSRDDFFSKYGHAHAIIRF
ncbi:sulfurtransferase complex subunit TusC [Agarivorans sp. MS3-6]